MFDTRSTGGRHRKGRLNPLSVTYREVTGPVSGPAAGPSRGPFDVDPRDGRYRLDLGSVRVPLPFGARLRCESEESGVLHAVHLLVPAGRVTVSAFAAPRLGGLWSELSEELAENLVADGATVRRDRGEWGRELVARSGETLARVVGIDGPRWMLRGVGTGPGYHARELHGLLREIVRGTVVVRGENALPVRTLLPLRLPKTVPVPVETVPPRS